MNLKNMTEDELLYSIGEMQKEYISRVHPEMGEGIENVTSALSGTVFYSDNMDEAILVRTECIISISEDGNTASVEKPEWETGWEC